MALLDDVKMLKEITDTLQDKLILLIISESEQRILSYINAKRHDPLLKVPEELEYITRDISIKRFNKMNAEGKVSDGEEGSTSNWEKSYLAEYESILDSYTDKVDGTTARRGKFHFY